MSASSIPSLLRVLSAATSYSRADYNGVALIRRG